MHFIHESLLPASAAEAFAWHARPGALERLLPPYTNVRVVRAGTGIEPGVEVELEVPFGPLRLRWLARHESVGPETQFCDMQHSGPFRAWRHVHRMSPVGDGSCRLADDVAFELPFGFAGRAVAARAVEAELRRMFIFRHRRTAVDLERHRNVEVTEPMRIAITGASGLVGSALAPFLTTGGHEVVRVGRSGTPGANTILWNPAEKKISTGAFDGVDAVVHLAGENIAARRWSAAVKEEIARSRADGTRLVAETIARSSKPPGVLVCASAIGIYGDRGDELLDESSSEGADFLAGVCRGWEAAAEPARARGVRVVHLRFGVVLSARGGALTKMLLPFKLGAGGRVGSGKQWMSWIALDDAVGAIHFALTHPTQGAVNAVSPRAVTNLEFTKTLGRVLRRPTIFPMPEPVVGLAFGELGRALLLASQHVLPKRLEAAGFRFAFPDLEQALRFELGK